MGSPKWVGGQVANARSSHGSSGWRSEGWWREGLSVGPCVDCSVPQPWLARRRRQGCAMEPPTRAGRSARLSSGASRDFQKARLACWLLLPRDGRATPNGWAGRRRRQADEEDQPRPGPPRERSRSGWWVARAVAEGGRRCARAVGTVQSRRCPSPRQAVGGAYHVRARDRGQASLGAGRLHFPPCPCPCPRISAAPGRAHRGDGGC